MKAKRRKTYDRFMRKYARATMQPAGTPPKQRKGNANRRFWGEEAIRTNPRYRAKWSAGLSKSARAGESRPALGKKGHRTLKPKAIKARVKRYGRLR